MRLCDKVASAGIIVVSLWGVAFVHGRDYDLYFSHIPTGRLAAAIIGWVAAHYGPVVIALVFWRLADRSPAPWLFHISLLPSFYVLLAVGFRFMRSASKTDDWDATMGSPIIVAVAIMIGTMAVYYVGWIVGKLRRLRREEGRS
jgi:hypothetical protein